MKILAILVLLISSPVFAKGNLKVMVDLSPAGSFEIKSQIKGSVEQKGEKFFAKNLSVSVKSMKTGIDLRDEHTREKLEYKKHPKITILKAIGNNGQGAGIIKVKDIKKKFSFSYKIDGNKIKAKFKLNLKDFKFTGISYLGVGVEDEVTVEAIVSIKK